MSNSSSSYKNMIKSTAIFGGAQVILMLIVVIRAKFIAVFLGSEGMGINAVFQSTIAVIGSFSCLGIFQSAIRDISQAHERGDVERLSYIYAIFDKLVWIAGGLGVVICSLGAYWLSEMSFNNEDFTMYFLLLSISLLFTALSNGKMVLLQGTRNLNYLAKATVIGAVVGLAVGIPLYYFLGTLGIVLSIISSSLILYLIQFYYSRKINLVKIDSLKWNEIIDLGAPIVKLGIVLMISTVMITMFTYFTIIGISRFGKIEDVGLFQGIASITSQSIAIVISVLASDFFPRLSAIYRDRTKVNVMVNQQLELLTLIIAPIIVVLLVFSKPIIITLLSKDFLVVEEMLRLMSLSLLTRGIWLTMSYIILANGDKKAYFIYDALIGNGLLFIFNIVSYNYYGLQGLGISFLAGSMVVSCILFAIVKFKYEFSFSSDFIIILIKLVTMVIVAYLIIHFFEGWIERLFSVFILILILSFSLLILNKRIGILKIIKSRF